LLPGQVAVISLTIVLAAGIPVAGWALTSPTIPDKDAGWTIPSLEASGTAFAEPLDAPSLPSRPLQQTADSMPLPPGTLSPDAFAGAFIEATSTLDRSRSMVTIYIPAGPEGTFRAHLTGWGEYDYTCDAVRPDSKRLYCTGSRLPVGVTLVLILYQTSTGRPEFAVFRSSFLIPFLPASPTLFEGGPGIFIPPTFTPTAIPSDTPVPIPSATDTPLPPTDTPEPPTDTPLPPTDTPLPPTDTPEPPTDTPEPPTDTPEPPSDTPVPPTDPPPPDTPAA